MTRLVKAGGGEILGDTPERRVDILAELDGLHMTWSRFGAGQEGAGLHVHETHSDCFYVLTGELTVRLGPEDEQVALGPGTFACVPPHVVHGFRNASGAEETHLNFHAPGAGFADYMRGLARGERVPFDQHEPPADGGRPPADASFGEAVAAPGLAIAIREGAPDPSTPVWRGLYVLEGELTAGEDVAGPGAWLELPATTTVTGTGRFLDVRPG
jgi:mannose-6-phosphate isomerase-like protein (cupin superfamily)